MFPISYVSEILQYYQLYRNNLVALYQQSKSKGNSSDTDDSMDVTMSEKTSDEDEDE